MKNIKLRKWGRFLLALVSTCFFVIFIWILVDCFTAKRVAKSTIITYKVEDDIDYDITLKPNKFYSEEELKEQNFYIPSLMDSLKIKFNYSLTGNTFFSSVYTYEVILKLVAKDQNKTIWSHEEQILNSNDITEEDVLKVDVNNEISIDVDNYYLMAKEYYDLTGVDVDFIVEVNLKNNLSVKGYGNSASDKQKLSLSFPITKKRVTINKNIVKSNDKSIKQYQVDEDFNNSLFIFVGLLTVAITPVMIMSYVSLFNLTNLDDYDRKKKKIKTKYGHLLKKVDKEPVFRKKEVLDSYDIDELVDVCREKDLYINVYEVVKGKECWYYVEDTEKVYLYILKLDHKQINMKDNSMVININRKSKRVKKK